MGERSRIMIIYRVFVSLFPRVAVPFRGYLPLYYHCPFRPVRRPSVACRPFPLCRSVVNSARWASRGAFFASGRHVVRVDLAARSRLILAGAAACRRPSGERPGRRSSRRRKENAGPVAVPGRRLFVNLPRLAISRGVSRLVSTCRRFPFATSSASAAVASNYASAVLLRLLLSETDPTMSGGAVAC